MENATRTVLTKVHQPTIGAVNADNMLRTGSSTIITRELEPVPDNGCFLMLVIFKVNHAVKMRNATTLKLSQPMESRETKTTQALDKAASKRFPMIMRSGQGFNGES